MLSSNLKISAVAALLWLQLPLFAAEPYVGVGAGAGFVTLNNLRTGNANACSGLASNLLLGLPINAHLALEAEYASIGKFIDPSVSMNITSVGVSAVGILPLGNSKFSLRWKGGIASTTATATPMAGYSLTGSESTDKTGITLGFSAQYEMSPNVSLRLSADSYAFAAATASGRGATLNALGIFRF